MAKINLVQKKVQMGHNDIVKYQLITYCFIHSVKYSDSELDCLTLLAIRGESELSEFCSLAVAEGIFKTSQTVRNFLTKAGKLNMVLKEGSNKKQISLTKVLELQTQGNIMLDFKLIHVTKEQ